MKENIGSENNKVIEKILQHIQEDKIESKKDLKLYTVRNLEIKSFAAFKKNKTVLIEQTYNNISQLICV